MPIAFARHRTALLRANIGILQQKLGLMHALRKMLGPEQANLKFAEKCPVVGASIGQHFRHSLDHVEKVAKIIEANNEGGNEKEIHFDIRARGGSDENDMDDAEERIQRVTNLFREDIHATRPSSLPELAHEYKDNDAAAGMDILDNTSVLACFMLSGDPQADEFMLSSTIERELGFVAHHAIHHLAMVKIITMHTLKLLPPDALPKGFGLAPSTIVYESSQEQEQQSQW
mmetsp:Transcript_62756/g.127872  ORF Transcript_62756/g.127872 Transcript_62756/m.127872 type:complete len:230 (+) Transcript_62756:127-816(+)|eukprot:CAMPEP_0201192072 /NCGR_PEP_ID=MMETSP0851-20130426/143860_1 /ASSEMBLY_ACC=CAM_ASM_000631 /TAXON_ID=183588 /ORGANISM="Pseudo-nitzschia fraudulenta, Strain WWA7" /LENGTH=229 /DNA_ID=CAMNT_0047478307 /DNA_START=123 /DNA_END=812 /DNA_ORIENTATION=-